MPPEDELQTPVGMGAPPGGGMPVGTPNIGGMPMGGEEGGNFAQELDQLIEQMPQEQLMGLIQKFDQNPQGTMMEIVEQLGGDTEAGLNIAMEFMNGVIAQVMTVTGQSFEELLPNLAGQAGEAGTPEVGGTPQGLPSQPGGSMPQPGGGTPSILGGGFNAGRT